MSQPHPLTSWLAPHFDHFVALRQACGVGYASQRKLLVRFDRYVDENARSLHYGARPWSNTWPRWSDCLLGPGTMSSGSYGPR